MFIITGALNGDRAFDTYDELVEYLEEEGLLNEGLQDIHIVENPTELGSGGMVFLEYDPALPSPFLLEGKPIYRVLVAEFDQPIVKVLSE